MVVGLDRDGDGRVLPEACGRTADGHVSRRETDAVLPRTQFMGDLAAQVRICESPNPQNLVESMPHKKSFSYQVLRLEDSQILT